MSLVVILEHVVGELVGRVELVARDRVERREVVLGGRLLALVIFVGDEVAEPVGIAQVAAEQRLQRVALEGGFVAVLEQLEQPVVRALPGPARRSRRRSRLLRRGGGHGEREQRRGQDQRRAAQSFDR